MRREENVSAPVFQQFGTASFYALVAPTLIRFKLRIQIELFFKFIQYSFGSSDQRAPAIPCL